MTVQYWVYFFLGMSTLSLFVAFFFAPPGLFGSAHRLPFKNSGDGADRSGYFWQRISVFEAPIPSGRGGVLACCFPPWPTHKSTRPVARPT